MAREFKEVATLRGNDKKFDTNYSQIDWGFIAPKEEVKMFPQTLEAEMENLITNIALGNVNSFQIQAEADHLYEKIKNKNAYLATKENKDGV